jgi:parallel beta-helix repeat protein
MVFNLDNSPQWTFRDLTTRNSYYHGFKFDHASTDCALVNVVMRDHGESGVKGTSDPAAGTYPDRLLVDSCDIGFTAAAGGTRSVVEGIDGVGVNDWVIRYSRFVNIQKGGAPAYAIFTKGNSSNTIIEGNRFENCFIGASFGGGGTGAAYFRDNDQTYEHRNGIIRNNLIMRCTDAGIYINKGHQCRIYNNTVFECVLTIQLRYPQTTGYVCNNLVMRAASNPNEPVIRLRDGATFLDNRANSAAMAADFITASGTYAQLDLHLRQTSPAVDAGVDVVSFVPADFEGDARGTLNAFDIGADEVLFIPVELHGFTARAADGGVQVEWITESELNNAGFFVERALLPGPFERIGFVPGRNGGTRRICRFFDAHMPGREARLRYRLRQVDTDGTETLHGVAELLWRPAPAVMAIYPSPASGRCSVRHGLRGDVELRICDLLGRVLQRGVYTSSPLECDVSALPGGVYFLHLRSAGGDAFARLTVRR